MPHGNGENAESDSTIVARRWTVRGVVQGVGFRPFVHRIAVASGLFGFVENTSRGVTIHVEGTADALKSFAGAFRREMPPAARVASVTRRHVLPLRLDSFVIRESRDLGEALSTIPPDLALCADCARELSDPADRRFRYPFINCTNCGPRVTIASALPYDRPNTSMAVFPLCPLCAREYADPADRRFHAEPNACPMCGPRLSLLGADGSPAPSDDPLRDAARALCDGKVVAVKGLGGFLLAVDATSEAAVTLMRARKRRDEKPLAVMVRSLAEAKAMASVSAAEARLMTSSEAPIVLLNAKKRSPLAPSIAPGMTQVGIFLPYTPLHRLLLDEVARPLVMTSGNLTDEPIAAGNDEAVSRLSGIADFFLVHDREVVQRADDSVSRIVAGKPYLIRRARGLVPAPVLLRRRVPTVAGLGGEIKGTFCVAKGNFAWLSQHLGDLDHLSTRDAYAEAFRFFRTFLHADFDVVCHDLHPAYFTTAFASEVPARRTLGLQHHKAHVYSLIAESGFRGKAVAVAFDGTGYGEDGTIWGGEFFTVDGDSITRAAHLLPFPLQGGDSTVKEPWKTGLSLLVNALGPAEGVDAALRLFPDVDPDALSLVASALFANLRVVPTTSCGRLFDGVAAIAGACRKASFEGQAPMRLEGAIPRSRRGLGYETYPFSVDPVAQSFGDSPGTAPGPILAVDWRPIVASIADDTLAGVPLPVVSKRFHDTVVAMVVDTASHLAEKTGARHVLLTGGVFQNAYLVEALLPALRRMGLKPVVHRQVPANDGGISLGQAYYAGIVTG